ncbi:MAG: DUF58 domain-containing protein [Myxococcales bacterium]|nr:DUF58 domain-containing protein [Myxococcales bacterium]
MIPRELVKKLRKIEIHTARLANDQLAGGYHSVFKGRGMAFAEVRQYQPGDDVRFIDWNVSARMNDAYVKVFTEEREMTVMLLVDLSRSEQFGSVARPKIEVVAEVAALLAFSAIKNNDRVGLILFTDRVERFVPPKKGKGHVMRVVTEILNAKPEGTGTDVRCAIDMLGKVAKRKSVAFLVSDFLDQGWERSLRVASQRHDIIPLRVTDPREEDLPDVGIALLEDLETGDFMEVDTSDPKVRHAFHQRVAQARERREQMFRKLRIDHVSVSTDADYVKPIAELFRLRQRRMGGFR